MATDRARTRRVSDEEIGILLFEGLSAEATRKALNDALKDLRDARTELDQAVGVIEDRNADLDKSEQHRAELAAELTRVMAERDEARAENENYLEQIVIYRDGSLHRDFQATALAHNEALESIATLEAQLAEQAKVGTRAGIYIASKTKHADRWRLLRDRQGLPVTSTWIDEAGPGESVDLIDLWRRCIHEASHAHALIVFREGDEVLKGGWIEVGAALASGVPVLA